MKKITKKMSLYIIDKNFNILFNRKKKKIIFIIIKKKKKRE
jgi:hypothetical protein